MKVLITGGAGFLGSNIADKLILKGENILVIDNFATGRRDNLKPHSNLKIVEGSIYDSKLVNSVFQEFSPDIVVHAAASYKDPKNWEEDIRTNVYGTALITQAALEHKVKRLIYFQTSLCYGLKPVEQPITLEHPIKSEGSSYAISKTAGEQYITLSGINFISFRLANMYGPRNLSGPVPTFYQRLNTGQKCYLADTRRDFVFVEDLLEVVLPAIYGKGNNGYYHISSGGDYSIKELFDAIVEKMGIKLTKPIEVQPRNSGDVYTILLDPSKTNKDFGWKTTTPLKEGIKKAVEYYKTYGIKETFTHLRIEK
ncbi:MAG: NAD-dependent epimerase/dehydratase family protein [bacterium]